MRLNFHVKGNCVPLVIRHGFLGSSDYWRALSKRFAAHCKVYRLDLRSHGASLHGPAMSDPATADDFRELTRQRKSIAPIWLPDLWSARSQCSSPSTSPTGLSLDSSLATY